MQPKLSLRGKASRVQLPASFAKSRGRGTTPTAHDAAAVTDRVVANGRDMTAPTLAATVDGNTAT